MSLLMKALKQAEQAKKAEGSGEAAPVPEGAALTLETQAGIALERTPFTDAKPPIAPQGGSPAPLSGKSPPLVDIPKRDDRVQAKNLFDAKLPLRSKRKPLFWAVTAGVLLVAGVIQGYRFWQEYTRPTHFSTVPHLRSQAVQVGKSLAEAPVGQGSSPATTPLSASKTAPVTESAPMAVPPPILAEKPKDSASPTENSLTQRPTRQAKAGTVPRNRGDAVADPAFPVVPGKDAIQISPSALPHQSPRKIDIAYKLYMQNDLMAARKVYQQVMEGDAGNRDALLGLAAIAIKSQHPEQAATYYRRLLALDPKDPAAQAGMISLNGSADTIESESRIKTLLHQQPNADYLYFALGNLYLGQSRWPEAQDAFFHAYRLSPDNPDYAFNLAVSLDHLHQPRQAADFYRKSLDLALSRPANFDRENLEKRLRTLTAAEKP